MRSYAFVLLMCVVGTLLSSIAQADEQALPLIDGPAYTRPQDMVHIDADYRLNLYCAGKGAPTVIFEAGQGATIALWGFVQPVVAKNVRTCSYDRAGIGFSDASPHPSTAANMVDDLHRLLVAADIKPPYILVGHSLGGMIVRLYADRYPAEIAGMVQVDPAVEDQTEAFRSLDPQHRTAEQWRATVIEPDLEHARNCVAAAKVGLVRGSDMFKDCVAETYPQVSDAVNEAIQNNMAKPDHMQADLSEMENLSISADAVRASRRSYGDLPLAVLTRGKWPAPKADATPEELANAEARHRMWNTLHDNVARLSSRGTNEIVEGARHWIPYDKPQAVIDAIDKVVAQVRAVEVAAGK
jgi:pimeloyl-ACP methyl ester carboxylesterase